MKRLTHMFAIALIPALLSVGVAAAASLGLTTGKLGASSATVSGCTASSLTATRNVNNSGNVTQVNVLSVPQACAGETLAVTLEDAAKITPRRIVTRPLFSGFAKERSAKVPSTRPGTAPTTSKRK